MKSSKVYYSHSMGKYGSEEESIELRHIENQFPGAIIINPGSFEFQKKWKEPSRGIVMQECFKLIEGCNYFVFSEHIGYIGKGVYDEIIKAHTLQKQIFLLRNGKFIPFRRSMITFKMPFLGRFGKDWQIRFARIDVSIEGSKVLNWLRKIFSRI